MLKMSAQSEQLLACVAKGLRDIDELRKIRFPRSVKFKKPILVVLRNGSQEACCSIVNLR
jgi:hypothetical protein